MIDATRPSAEAAQAAHDIISRGIPEKLVVALIQATFQDGVRAGTAFVFARTLPVSLLAGTLFGTLITYLALR